MWCIWSAKGGVGCTVVAAALSLGAARRGPTLLVDLGGDATAVLGRSDGGPGLGDWLQAPCPPPDALARMETSVAPSLSILRWGAVTGARFDEPAPAWGSDRRSVGHDQAIRSRRPDRRSAPDEILARMIGVDARTVVVDVGQRRSDDGARSVLAQRLMSLASRSTLVTRACSLASQAVARWPPPDDVIVVSAQGRARRAAEVEEAVGAPVIARLRWDPAVARAVDAGVLITRPPRSLRRLGRTVVS